MHVHRAARRIAIVGVLVALCTAPGWGLGAQELGGGPVVVLGIPTEVKDVEAQLRSASVERVQGLTFTVGHLGSRRVVLARTAAGKVNRSLKAVAVEMEGAAIAQVSEQLRVPAIVIRSITDSADASTPDAYAVNRDAASWNAATLTMAAIAQLGSR